MTDNPLGRVRDADRRAERSNVAFALGPDVFTNYMQTEADAARKRIEALYGESDAAGSIAPQSPPGTG